jgi:guanyl-specific ribonuclease Sa
MNSIWGSESLGHEGAVTKPGPPFHLEREADLSQQTDSQRRHPARSELKLPAVLDRSGILRLQRLAGNAAVTGALRGHAGPIVPPLSIQRLRGGGKEGKAGSTSSVQNAAPPVARQTAPLLLTYTAPLMLTHVPWDQIEAERQARRSETRPAEPESNTAEESVTPPESTGEEPKVETLRVDEEPEDSVPGDDTVDAASKKKRKRRKSAQAASPEEEMAHRVEAQKRAEREDIRQRQLEAEKQVKEAKEAAKKERARLEEERQQKAREEKEKKKQENLARQEEAQRKAAEARRAKEAETQDRLRKEREAAEARKQANREANKPKSQAQRNREQKEKEQQKARQLKLREEAEEKVAAEQKLRQAELQRQLQLRKDYDVGYVRMQNIYNAAVAEATPFPTVKVNDVIAAWAQHTNLRSSKATIDALVVDANQVVQTVERIRAEARWAMLQANGRVSLDNDEIDEKALTGMGADEAAVKECVDGIKGIGGWRGNGGKWGDAHHNNERFLPAGNYLEYYVRPRPSESGWGTRRIVKETNTDRYYYTGTHYAETKKKGAFVLLGV